MNQDKKKLLIDADSCVKCGLCLPHCPTYTHTQNENESPRGRIALIQAWAGEKLSITEKLVEHIDHCLLCRSCEKVCPAVVPYGRLIDNFREQIHNDIKTPISVTFLRKIAENKKFQKVAKQSLRSYQKNKFQKIARFLHLPSLVGLGKLERLMPKSQNLTALQTFYSSQIEVKGDVSLFIGCMGELVDFETVNSAIQVLTRVGFNVHIPITQTCCGALSLHAGDKNMFEQLKITNLRAFEDDKFQTIISIASGCGSALREYDNQKFAEKIIDINHFLIKQSIDFNFLFKPLKKIVCLHTPCSLKNVLKTDKSVSMLLQKIPELEIINLPETQQCCGAAGSYVLKHHEFSNTLVTELIDNVVEKNPDYLVSSNVGCALHISATLREQNNQLEIIHPVVLLARQLTFCQ